MQAHSTSALGQQLACTAARQLLAPQRGCAPRAVGGAPRSSACAPSPGPQPSPPLVATTTVARGRLQDFRDRNELNAYHRDQVDRVRYVHQVDKYVTCARDGSFRWVQALVGRLSWAHARRGAAACAAAADKVRRQPVQALAQGRDRRVAGCSSLAVETEAGGPHPGLSAHPAARRTNPCPNPSAPPRRATPRASPGYGTAPTSRRCAPLPTAPAGSPTARTCRRGGASWSRRWTERSRRMT